MKERLKKEKLVAQVYLLFQMDLLMKVRLKIIKFMVKENIQILPVMFMMGSFLMEH